MAGNAVLMAVTGLLAGAFARVDGAISGRYLMAFHACEGQPTDCDVPGAHRVYVAQSNNGRRWSLVPRWDSYPGSVPGLVQRGGEVYVYTSRLVRRHDLASGRWGAPEAVEIVAASGERAFAADPCPLVVDGRLVLFVLEGHRGQDPARCAPDEKSCRKRFFAAWEVEGTNGRRFTLEAEPRLEVEVAGGTDSASDPSIFLDPRDGRYTLYVSRGMKVQVWRSDGALGPWREVGDLNQQGSGGVPAGLIVDGEVWTYATARRPPGPDGRQVIVRARHDGYEEVLEIEDFRPVRVRLFAMGAMASPSVIAVEEAGR